ncbi:MAG: hypothetical protein R3C56_19420 [Pirellulaceae bacterium]
MSWAIDAKAERYGGSLQAVKWWCTTCMTIGNYREFLVKVTLVMSDPTLNLAVTEGTWDSTYGRDGRTSVQLFDLLAQAPYLNKCSQRGEAHWRQIAFSPDSQHFLYQAPDHSLQVINLESLVIRQIR